MNKKIGVMVCLLVLGACSSSSSTTTSSSEGIKLDMAGSFTTSASALMKAATTAACSSLSTPITMDDPSLADGLDCDGDGGIVAHVTPSQYAIAFKRISLVSGDGSPQIDFIADTTTLSASEVVNFTSTDSSESIVTIDPADLQAGTYTGIEAEIYYFQLTFPVGGTTRNVRIYMSDDDFAAQGSLGHHQGDIIFISDSGVETGWVDSEWDATSTTRGDEQNGAGGTDAQTGHDRGFFGNAEFWDATDQDQGASQDNFVMTLSFDEEIVIPDPDTITDLTTITATFSIADTFYYEDFSPQGTGFSPASGGEATSEGGEWAPLAPEAELAVTSS